jgi:hypothetical protein
VKNGFNSAFRAQVSFESLIPNGNQEQRRRPKGEQKLFLTIFGTAMRAKSLSRPFTSYASSSE